MSKTEKTPARIAVIDLTKRRVRLLEAEGGFGGYATVLFMAGDLPRNHPALCLLTGPLTGTGAPGSGCYGFLWREKARGGTAFTEGRLGSALRYSGIDYLIIHGRADKPVWLCVSDGSVDICDEDGLRDMSISQITDLLYSKSDYDDSSALVLGHRDDERSLVEDYRFEMKNRSISDAFETMNLAAVMASGIGYIPICKPEKFLKECVDIYKYKPASEIGPVKYGDGAVTGHYLSPWRTGGEDMPVIDALDDDGLALRLAGLYWDEACPLPDTASYAAKLLSCVLPDKWDAAKLADAAKQMRGKVEELAGKPLRKGGAV